jgi:hypothetical protein
MQQKKITRQPLIRALRQKREYEKFSPYLKCTHGPKRHAARPKRTRVRIAGSNPEVILAPTVKEVETRTAEMVIKRWIKRRDGLFIPSVSSFW